MESLNRVTKILRHRNCNNLADLLSRACVEFDESNTYGSYFHSWLPTAEIYAPISDYDRLDALSSKDNKQMLDVILEIWPHRPNDMEITGIIVTVQS